jgi:hypothetical protein
MQDISEESVPPVGPERQSAPVSALRERGLFGAESLTRMMYLLAGLVLIFLVFRYIQFSTAAVCCGDFDGYYHIRWSRLLWENMRAGHFPPAFTWLPLTTLNPNDYVDHHLLFHIFQIPFTWLGDLRLAAKISATIFATLALFSCYWLIVRYRIKYTLVWLVALLACSSPFLYRLSMAKAPPLAIIFTIIGIVLLFERKYVWLAPLMFLYVWTYSLWVTLGMAAVIWTLVVAWYDWRIEWRPVAWTTLGTALGFIINPYFPKNFKLFVEHVLIKMTPSAEYTTKVGSEWYPYESWYFLLSCFVAFAAMLIGYVAFNGRDKKHAARPLFFLLFSTLLMIASFHSRRFVEYWPPFAVLFAAFTLQPLLDGVRTWAHELPSDVMNELQPFLDRHDRAVITETTRREEWWKNLAVIVVAVVLALILFFSLQGWRGNGGLVKEIAGEAGPDRYSKGMEWIRTNVPANEVIFNSDWDDFPKLFFYDTTHRYTSGLDPTYLLDQNPELSKLYESITLGKEKDPGPILRDRFGAHYIFSDNEDVHDDLYASAMDSGWFDKVYEDDDCWILKLRDQKGDAPKEEGESNDVNGTDEGNDNSDEEDAPEDNTQTFVRAPELIALAAHGR